MKKYVILLCAAAALFLGSCNMQPPKEDDPNEKKFWAIDFTKVGQPGYLYQAKARQLYEGDKCVIYAETTAGISIRTAEQFAREYSEKIYGVMLEYFCDKNFEVNYNGTKTTYADTLEYAFSLVDNQDKLIILLLDIRDGYSGNGYVAGYFDPRNLYYGTNSNYKNMIYVDTNPGMNNQEEMFSTFAHELQHLINYVTSIRIRPNGQSPYPHQMDTWIDEGLSLMAEYLYQEKPLESRIRWFINDPMKTIAWGNNFYVWDNYDSGSFPNAVLDDYATAYLFFQWLYLQTEEDPALLKKIAASGKYDYRAVTENTGSIIPGGDNWETLLRTWLAANYINDPENEYGYKGNEAFKNITVKPYLVTDNNSKIKLFPGEGVYSTIKSSFVLPANDSGENIRYAGLQKGAPFIINTSGPSYTGDSLLTFNKNTEGTALESGYFTGEDVPVTGRPAVRAVGNFPYPIRIDARDLMRRNGAPAQTESVPKKARLPADEH